MKKSIYDPGFDFSYEAYLDGQKVEGCVMADEENGMVQLYKRDDEGNYIINNRYKILVTEYKYGKVKIKRLKK